MVQISGCPFLSAIISKNKSEWQSFRHAATIKNKRAEEEKERKIFYVFVMMSKFQVLSAPGSLYSVYRDVKRK